VDGDGYRRRLQDAIEFIEIAFEYRYSAPESFLRAFKAMFGATPSSFRKKGRYASLHAKADLTGRVSPGMKGAAAEGERPPEGLVDMRIPGGRVAGRIRKVLGVLLFSYAGLGGWSGLLGPCFPRLDFRRFFGPERLDKRISHSPDVSLT
jgi:hypothetical protein